MGEVVKSHKGRYPPPPQAPGMAGAERGGKWWHFTLQFDWQIHEFVQWCALRSNVVTRNFAIEVAWLTVAMGMFVVVCELLLSSRQVSNVKLCVAVTEVLVWHSVCPYR